MLVWLKARKQISQSNPGKNLRLKTDIILIILLQRTTKQRGKSQYYEWSTDHQRSFG